MATSIIEGIDNEVLFVVSVFVAFVAIYLVHLLYNSNINLNSGQNTPNTAADSVSFSSSEEHAQENTTDEQADTRPADSIPFTDDFNQTETWPLHSDVNEATSGPVNDTDFPQVDRTSDGVHWRGSASAPVLDGLNGSAEDCISIRVKFMENERTLSVNRTITIGELKRLCFLNELNNGRMVRLIFSGRLLQDDTAPISFYGVTNLCVVHAQISDIRRDNSTAEIQEADLDLSKLFLPILAIILTLCWYAFFCYRHIFSAASIIILVCMTLAFGVLAHAMTS